MFIDIHTNVLDIVSNVVGLHRISKYKYRKCKCLCNKLTLLFDKSVCGICDFCRLRLQHFVTC